MEDFAKQFAPLTGEALAVPTVHLNGSGLDLLIELQTNALNALREAEKHLMAASPNGRDFYVQPPGAVEAATEQHTRRLWAVSMIIAELTEIAERVDGQGPKRKTPRPEGKEKEATR